MILYLDTSALMKKYTEESGSDIVRQTIASAYSIGISLVGRVEMAAALAKLIRVEALEYEEALAALQSFKKDWPHLIRFQVTKAVAARAESLAWDYHLRGYDAVHLATAVTWQEVLGEPLTMAVFDQKLWTVAAQVGLIPFPADLGAF